jgi:deoxyribonuclease-4
MEVASLAGIKGVIFHPGNHGGLGFDKVADRCAEAISKVLSSSSGCAELIIENSAGMGNSIGSNFSEIGTLISRVNDDRCKVCIDTQHSYAAGYDITGREGLNLVLQEFEDYVGFHKLAAIHVNDSKKPLGSGVDRHENLGEGYLGLSTFENLVTHEALKDIPLILEVPGKDRKGPDQCNIDILKGFRKAAFG